MKGDLLEELMYEYYTLKGYFCIRNLPGKPKGNGGRDEYDLIGIKILDKTISEIIWVEVTTYLSNKITVNKKFTKDKEKYLKRFLKDLYGIKFDKTINKIFFISHDHKNLKNEKNLSATIITMNDILNEIRNLIHEYKEKYCKVSGAKSKPSKLTLPESLKMIELIDTIRKNS